MVYYCGPPVNQVGADRKKKGSVVLHGPQQLLEQHAAASGMQWRGDSHR